MAGMMKVVMKMTIHNSNLKAWNWCCQKKTAVPVKPSGTRKGKGKSTASGVDSGNAPDVAGDESPPQSPSKAKTATPNTTVTNPFFGPDLLR